MLLERWTLEFVRGPPPGSGSGMAGAGGGSGGTRTYLDEASVYKRLVSWARVWVRYWGFACSVCLCVGKGYTHEY